MPDKPTYEELVTRIEELESTARKNEEFFRKIFDLIPSCIIIKDRNGKFVLANKNTASFYGPNVDEMIGKFEFDYAGIHPSNQPEIDKFLADDRHVIDTGEEKIIPDEKFTLSDGDVHTFHVSKIPISTFGYENCVLVVATDITEIRKTEANLRHSQKMLARTESITHIGSWEWEISTDTVTWSEELFRIFQLDPNDGAPSWAEHPQLYHPEDFVNLRQAVEAAVANGTPYEMELRAFRKDGETRVCQARGFSEMGSNGKPVRLFGSFHDITERKRAEEVLRDSNEKLTALFQSSPMAIITLDPDGNVTFWNPAAEKMFGWKEKEAVGRFLPFVPEGKKSEHHALRNRVLSGEGFHNVEALRQKKDGSDIYISISTVPLKDSTGSISGIMSVIVDITERKETEEALRKSQQIIEGIINAIPVRVFWKDKNLVYLGCNAIFAHDAGFADPKDIIGKDDYQMGWCDQAELYRGDDRQVIESGVSKLLIEEPQTTPEGNTITLLTSKIPLRNSTGEISGVLGTYKDITERKRMEETLLRAQKLESVGLLAGGIAHDFNYILTTILGNVSMAKTQVKPEDDIFDLLKEAEMASIRAQALTKQLLTFAKGGVPLKETASIKDILKESSSFVLRGSKSNCEFSLIEDLWPAEVDVGQISQVINNIVINANQSMPKGGTI